MLFLIYLLKVSACLAVFYGLYFFVFRRFTFHTLNRFYLLCTLCLSFIIPLISFETTKVVKVEPAVVGENSPETGAPSYGSAYAPDYDSQAIAIIEPVDETPDWRFYVVFVYIVVAVIMLLFLGAKLFKIYQLSRQAISVDNLRIVQRSGQLTNASFFNLIFLNTNGLTDNEKAQIIAHECVHIRHLHSIDVLLVELCKITLWFNPIIYFYKKSLIEVHEFEADLNTIQQFDSKNYAHLLLKLGINQSVDLANQFSLHPLSTRIQFLFKKRTVSIKRVFYVLGLPFLALGIFVFAQRHEKLIYKAAVKVSERVNDKITGLSQELKSINKDTLERKEEVKPLASMNQNDSTTVTFGSMINPFLFKIPEVELPYSGKITSSNELNKILIKTTTTPEEFSFDYFKGGRAIVENTTEGNIKILQDGEDLIKDKDYTFIYREGYISKIKFKEHIRNKNLSITIIVKDLSFRALPEPEAIPLPSIYYRRGENDYYLKENKKQNSLWRYGNFGTSSQSIGITTDDLRTSTPVNPLGKEPKQTINLNSPWRYKVRLNSQQNFSTDSLRTYMPTNFLGKDPLVIINGQEYPSSILQKLDPKSFGWSYLAEPNEVPALEKYGEKARDGVLEIRTKDDFLFKSEKDRQLVLENIRRELDARKIYKNDKIVRVRLLEQEGKEFERVIIKGFFEDKNISVDIPVNGKIHYEIDGVTVSEADVINYDGLFQGSGGRHGKIPDKNGYHASISLHAKKR